ncbi:MAG: hypothetical protein IJ809_01895 [Clostridia bacterium]|nr:hypothetical protein [Clostridia bacterium]
MFVKRKFNVLYEGRVFDSIMHNIYYGETDIGASDVHSFKKYLDNISENPSEYEENNDVKKDTYFIGRNKLHYFNKECPIITYESESRKNINAIVKRISVSVVISGIEASDFSFNSGSPKSIFLQPESDIFISYFTDLYGVNQIIYNYQIHHMLLSNPHVFVTKEGVIILFNRDEIFATIDMINHTPIEIKNDLYDKIRTIEINDDDSISITIHNKVLERKVNLRLKICLNDPDNILHYEII